MDTFIFPLTLMDMEEETVKNLPCEDTVWFIERIMDGTIWELMCKLYS